MATGEKKGKHLKSIHIHLRGHGTENEGFEVEHEYEHKDGSGYLQHGREHHGVMKHHGHVIEHIHEHIKDHGSEEAPEDEESCIHPSCDDVSEDIDEDKEAKSEAEHEKTNMGRHGYEKKTPNAPGGGHTKKHPGFKAVENKIASKEGLSHKAAGAILAARSRGASKAAHEQNPRLNRVRG